MAFSTAISGIKAAQANLDVISNNIANASTVGFKASRAEFAEIYASSVSGGSNAGQGVELTEIRADFSQGSLDFTGNGLDLAISGNGFFIVSNGGASEYTRAGSFLVDRDGFLTNESGNRLQGYQGNTDGVITGELGDLFIDTTLVDPKVTSKVTITSNLDPGKLHRRQRLLLLQTQRLTTAQPRRLFMTAWAIPTCCSCIT